MSLAQKKTSKIDAPASVVWWLVAIYMLVALMVLIGGITRLTGSGLSMVTWKPVMGLLPPTSDVDWQNLFAQYKASPQFQQVNHWMDLSDFKGIFFWEYVHRVFGRFIGIAFFVPWFVFTVRGMLRGRLAFRAFIAFVLGGLQGFLGWYMVKSGLVDVPAVSHYRLASHLGLAFFIGAYVFWLILDLRDCQPRTGNEKLVRAGRYFLVLTCVQIIFGAFMAGTRAGYLYQTFPDMNGVMVPASWLDLSPIWVNFLENHHTIHFVHRSLGWVVLLAGIILTYAGLRGADDLRQRRAAQALGVALGLQFLIGVLTVVKGIPVAWGAAHQIGAFIMLSVLLLFMHRFGDQPGAQPSTTP